MVKITDEVAKLATAMRDLSTSEIFDGIKNKVTSNSEDVANLVSATFHLAVAENSAKRRSEVFKSTISLLQTADLPFQVTNDIVSFLMAEVDSFQTSLLMEMCEYFVIQIKNYNGTNVKWLDIFPSMLSSLATRDTIVYDGNDMSGKDLKRNIVHSLCSSKFEPRAVAQLVPVLHGVKLLNEEIKQIVKIALSAFPKLKYQEMPQFVYELLKFPAASYRKNILQDIMSYFIEEDQKIRNTEEVCETESESIVDRPDSELFHQIEGSVILMIQLCCNQEPALEEVFLQTFKSFQYMSASNLSSFVFSVALSLTSIEACEQTILNIMKTILFNTFRQKEKCHQSVWMRDLFPHVIDTDVIEHIKEVVVHSKHGWDHVSQGLIKFGFILLDAYGPKPVFGKVPNLSKPHIMTIAEQSCLAGITILSKAFKNLQNMRAKIFEEILNRIILKTSGPVTHYIDVLSRTVQNDPQLLLEVLARIMTILEYLPYLPYNNALGVLKALTPLLKISMPLKDALMLILCKAMFHSDIEPRKIAIAGYLAILKKIGGVSKMCMSESQCSSSSQGSTNSLLSQGADGIGGGTNARSKSMCLEIMGILKRSLMQQEEVKRLLYEGFHDVVLKNTSLADIILELLLSQFEQYSDFSDSSDVPIDIPRCFSSQKDTAIVSEPIPYLIATICLILVEVKDRYNNSEFEDYEQSAQTVLEEKLKAITRKMIEIELVVFDLDKTEDADSSNSSSCKKEKLHLLLGVYNALMEYSVMSNNNWSVEGCEEALSLHLKTRKIIDILQAKNPDKTTKSKAPAATLPQSIITMRCISKIIENLFSNECDAHQDGLHLLRSDVTFPKYILNVCIEKMNALNETGKLDGFSDNMVDNYDYIFNIARVFLRAYSAGLKGKFPSLEYDEVAITFVEGLSQIFSYMFAHEAEIQEKFISDLGRQVPSTNDDAACEAVKKFQRLTVKALSDTEDVHLKEVIPLLSIIGHICTIPSVYKKGEVYEWAKQLCIEQTFEDISVAKKLLSLCLNLSHHQKDRMEFLREIASDIHIELGNSDSEVPINGTKTYNVITEKTALHLFPLVIQHSDRIMSEVKLVLNILKADINFARNSMHMKARNHSKNEATENSICKLLVELIKVFHELVQAAIPVGNVSQLLGQTTASLYKILTSVCKYYINIYDRKIGRVHSSFEGTVRYLGMHLTPQVYSFMTYVQSVEERNKKKTAKDPSVKATRSAKTQSCLVFAIEEYEQSLLPLASKAKKNWTPYLKLSTSRDFRIIQENVENQVEESRNGSELHSSSDSSSNTTAAVPEPSTSKKRKVKEKPKESKLSKKKKTRSK